MITIEKDTAIAKSNGATYQLSLSDFISGVTGKRNEFIYPDGLKLLHCQDGVRAIAVYEIPAAVHSIRWIADDSPEQFGSGTKYTTRRLATPYIVLVLPMAIQGDRPQLYTNNCECFVRNHPITSINDELFYPPFLNVSKWPESRQNSFPLAWLCTQYIDLRSVTKVKTLNERIWKIIHQSRSCLLESGFNYSSEQHEGNSHYSFYKAQAESDPRIKDIKKWEKASIDEPLFPLEIPWISAGHSIKDMM